MDYQKFKNEISNLKAYYKSLRELEQERKRLEYELEGVKGIRYDKLPASFNPEFAEMYRLELIERLVEIEKEIGFTVQTIKRYESQINRLPDDVKPLVDLLFIQGKTFKEVGYMFGYSDNGIYHKIKKEIEKI